PLTMNAYALERFITQIKDVQGRYKEYLEYKAKSEDYSYRRRAEESKFHKYKTAEIESDLDYLERFAEKYKKYMIFSNNGQKTRHYNAISGDYEEIETAAGYAGIDYIEHIDELHTAYKLFEKYLR